MISTVSTETLERLRDFALPLSKNSRETFGLVTDRFSAVAFAYAIDALVHNNNESLDLLRDALRRFFVILTWCRQDDPNYLKAAVAISELTVALLLCTTELGGKTPAADAMLQTALEAASEKADP